MGGSRYRTLPQSSQLIGKYLLNERDFGLGWVNRAVAAADGATSAAGSPGCADLRSAMAALRKPRTRPAGNSRGLADDRRCGCAPTADRSPGSTPGRSPPAAETDRAAGR